MSQSRFVCTVPNCTRKQKNFSLVTLYEHLAHHPVLENHKLHCEYRCLNCDAYFTNRIFMVSHLRENKGHKIERVEIDLANPLCNKQLLEDCDKATRLLRESFKSDEPYNPLGQINGVLSRAQATPIAARDPYSYTPRTPNFASARPCMTPRTPTYSCPSQDFSNSFANADLPRTPTYAKRSNLGSDITPPPLDPAMLQQFVNFLEMQQQQSNKCNPRTPVRERFDGNIGVDRFAERFNRTPGDDFERDRSFGSRGSGFERGRSDDNGGFRGGRGGGGDRFSDRGRGARGGRGFRGAGGRGGRGGAVGARDDGRKSRSRSPLTKKARSSPSAAAERRSYSRSVSRSRSRSPAKSPKKSTVQERRSYSRSPKSD